MYDKIKNVKKIDFESENLIYKKTNYWAKFLSQAILLVCSFVAVFIIIFSIIFVSAPVKGISMQPTLNAEGDVKHDMVYINKVLPYGYEDIVVVERPTNSIDVNYIIKRVVGMPGDKIKIMQNQADKKVYVYRNGYKVDEPYLSQEAKDTGMLTTLVQFIEYYNSVLRHPDDYSDILFDSNGWLVLQEDQIFVLGDNRGFSEDSSALGPFYKNKVTGRVDFILPYGTIPFYYFLEYYTGISIKY